MKPALSQPRRSRPAAVTRACFGHERAHIDDLKLSRELFLLSGCRACRFGPIGVVQVVGMKRSDGVRMPDRARGKRRLQAACRCARVAVHPGNHVAAEGSDRGGLRRIGFQRAGVSVQRPLGEPLRRGLRIERFDRDLLRIERRIERKLVAGVGDAEEREACCENQVVHRRASVEHRRLAGVKDARASDRAPALSVRA